MLSTLDSPLTVDLIIQLHDIAVDQVKREDGNYFNKRISNGKVAYGLVFQKTDKPSLNYNATHDGLIELLTKIKKSAFDLLTQLPITRIDNLKQSIDNMFRRK